MPGPNRSIVSIAGTAIRVGPTNRGISTLAGGILRGGGTIVREGTVGDFVFRTGNAPVGGVGFGMVVQGMSASAAALNGAADSARRIAESSITVTSDLPYSYGIDFGRFRSGRIARRAGGTYALLGGVLQVYPRIVPRMAAAIARGPDAVVDEMGTLGREIVAATRQREAVKRGNLRRSFYAVTPRKGSPRVRSR